MRTKSRPESAAFGGDSDALDARKAKELASFVDYVFMWKVFVRIGWAMLRRMLLLGMVRFF